MQRKILAECLLLALYLVLSSFTSVSAQSIPRVSVVARLDRDGTLEVLERLLITTGPDGSYGLLRVIPTEFNTDKERHYYEFKLLETQVDNTFNRYVVDNSNGTAVIQLGDDSKFLVGGRHVVALHYLLRKAVSYVGGPHLHWDVLGSNIPRVIDSFNMQLALPVADARPLQFSAMAGPGGLGRPVLAAAERPGLRISGGAIAPGESLVVDVVLPRGAVLKPGLAKEFSWFFADWWPAILLPVFVFVLLGAVRWACGLAVAVPGSADEKIQLPDGLTPAELGTLLDDRCDLTDITATLIDLAQRGFLKIEELKSDEFISLSNRDYLFTKLKDDETNLAEHEKLLLAAIFNPDGEARTETRLSEIKTRFHVYGEKIQNAVYRSLVNKGQLLRTPADVAPSYFAVGFGLALIGLYLVLSNAGLAVAIGFGCLLSALVTFSFASSMPSRTFYGCKSLRQTRQFRGFLLTADREQVQKMLGEKAQFGHVLPYALVLGAADKLAEAFQDLIKEAPNWYRPYNELSNNNFSAGSFVSSLGSGMRTIERTFSLSAVSSMGEQSAKS